METYTGRRQNTHVFSGCSACQMTPAIRRSNVGTLPPTFTRAHEHTRATYGPWKKAHLLSKPPPSSPLWRVPIACLLNRPFCDPLLPGFSYFLSLSIIFFYCCRIFIYLFFCLFVIVSILSISIIFY